MNVPRRRIRERAFGSGSLLGQIFTTLSGTASAQFVTGSATLPLARLYSPLDFGFFAIFLSIVVFGVTIGALRYDMAIVLPKTDMVAKVVHRLASRSILVVSTGLSLGLLIAHPLISQAYDNDPFATWLVPAGIAVYFMAQTINVQFWLTRQQNYTMIAGIRLTQAIAVALFQIGFAPLIGGFQGLTAGFIVGQAVTMVLVLYRTPDLRGGLPDNARSMREVARRYRKMPLLNGPTAVVDGVQAIGINILIGNIALGGLGQYSLAYRLTQAPMGLVAGSVSQVLLQRLATTQPRGLLRILSKALVRLLLVALPSFTIFYFVAPSLFPLLFGDQWIEAGQIAQVLVPWLFMMTLTAPLSTLFIIVERQELPLVFSIVSTGTTLGFLTLSPLGLLASVRFLALIMAGFLLFWTGVALLVARDFDSSSQPRV